MVESTDAEFFYGGALDDIIDLIDNGTLISEQSVLPNLRERLRKVQDWILERRTSLQEELLDDL